MSDTKDEPYQSYIYKFAKEEQEEQAVIRKDGSKSVPVVV